MALEKVCLVTTILHNRDETNYARELLVEELSMGWGGITQEVQNICKEMGLKDATQQYLYRDEIKKAIGLHNLTIKRRKWKENQCVT